MKIWLIIILMGFLLIEESVAQFNAECARSTSFEELDINNVRTTIHNGGDMWWTVRSPSAARYAIPKNENGGSEQHSLFAGSIWIGGIDMSTGDLGVVASTYRQSHYSLWPGTVLTQGEEFGTTDENCAQWDRHFKVDRREIEDFILNYEKGLIQTIEDIPESILLWPGKNNPHLLSEVQDLDHDLAPFTELDNPDGIYDPLNGDYPNIKGDQAIWWVMNDMGNEKEFGGIESRMFNMGLEVQVMAHAYATDDPLDNMTFYDYKIINKGTRSFEEVYFSQWVDADLGFSGDDYVECDIPRGLAITYNGDNFDEGVNGYGDTPPAIGIDWFIGPLADLDTIGDNIDNDGDGLIDESDNGYAVYEGDGIDNDWDGQIDEYRERVHMSNFLYYGGNSNPSNGNPGSAQDFFNYQRGIWRDGTFMTHDFAQGTQQDFPRTNFFFPGDSWSRLASRIDYDPGDRVFFETWTETVSGNQPADRRMVPSVGPVTMESGNVVEYLIGVPWARADKGGARGSFDKLLCVDDYVQSLFKDDEIQFLRGPDAPDMEIVELENELVLTLQPAKFNLVNKGKVVEMNTENYREFDVLSEDYFEFEGYQIYQLVDGSIGPEDFDDPDKARLIAQVDLKNDVSRIVEYEFDYDLTACEYCRHIKVEGDDEGIKRNFRIKKDIFGEDSTLVNNKEYYFSVIAYGYNEAADNLNQFERVYKTYIESKNNIKVYTAIPHDKPGSDLTENYDQSFEFTRLSGLGNGGNRIELKEGIENSILSGDSVQITYDENYPPLDIRIYNPLVNINDQEIKVRLTGRLKIQKGDVELIPGDTIFSLVNLNQTDSLASNLEFRTNPYVKQSPGIAKIIREIESLETDDSETFEVRILNAEEGGTFVKDGQIVRNDAGELSTIDYQKLPARAQIIGLNESFLCLEFEAYDFWTLEADGNFYKSEFPISAEIEELIPDLGLSLRINNAPNPSYRPDLIENLDNGLQESEIIYEDQEWLIPVSFGQLPWIKPSIGNSIFPVDPLNRYMNVIDSSFTYWASSFPNVSELSLAPGVTSNAFNFSELPNADIVITSDRSKWTRCMVIQMGKPEESQVPPIIARSQKSDLLSLDKDGNEDASLAAYPENSTELSRGYSWFPGYAIDLDKGTRLNMVFAENVVRDSVDFTGDDLLYNPSVNDSNNHFIILTNMPYDMEDEFSEFQYIMDSVFFDQTSTRSNSYGATYQDLFTWIGTLKLNEEFEELPEEERGDVRVKLRVNKSYMATENGIHPEWSFKLKGNSLYTKKRMKEELMDIRIVPNPYILGSNYEKSLDERIVKITHLPPQRKISIFTASGSLVKTFNDSYSDLESDINSATQVWDMRNDEGKLINSGVYLIHIESEGVGEIVRKFIFIKRDEDLSSSF